MIAARAFGSLLVGALLVALALGFVAGSSANRGRPGPLQRIDRIVVIYEENHSFDNLYGGWEGVNGRAQAPAARTVQVRQDGTPYHCLLQDDVNLATPPLSGRCTETRPAFTSHFFNAPFNINDFIKPADTTCPPSPSVASTQPNGWLKGTGSVGGCTRDLVHAFYQEIYQLNDGRQNRYVTGSDAAGLTMGYYDTKQLPIYKYLHAPGHPRYAILDNFFQAAHGGSFLNHQWLIAARTPTFPGAPAADHSVLDGNGMPVLRSPPASQSPTALYVSPSAGPLNNTPLTALCPAPLGLACGDYAVNTSQSPSQPHSLSGFQIPLQTEPTIGDRLSAAGIDWAWYSGGWSNAAGIVDGPGWTNFGGTCSDPDSFPNPAYPYCPNWIFQFHHQPFNYYANYAEGAPGRSHLQDEALFQALVRSSRKGCNLKPVSFVKPAGQENEHPGYASTALGSAHLVQLLTAIERSGCRKRTMVIVAYDEFGGQWDHVPPPGQGGTPGPHDEMGPGTRIPALVISPLLKSRFAVDSTQYDTTSILATVERRFGLAPLTSRDAAVNDLSNVFRVKGRRGR